MTTIGSLAVSMRASSKRFTTGIDTAIRSVHRFKNAIPGANLVLSRTGALLGGLAAGGMAAYIRSQANAVDATAKFADRIGMSTEGLVGLQHAAGITGVKIAQLQMGLQRMTRRVAEAAQGTGEAKGAIKELGLSAEDLARMRPEDQFRVIADAMSGVTEQGDRVRLAMKLFDSEGVALVNTLALGSRGLEKMEKEARELGLTFSRVDAAKVEAANDALARVGAVLQGIGRTAAIELAPIVEGLAKKFTDWARESGGAGKITVDAIGFAVEAATTLMGAVEALVGGVRIFGGIALGTFAKIGWSIAQLQQGMQTLVEIFTLGIADPDWGNELEDQMEELNETAQRLKDTGADMFERGWNGEARQAAMRGVEELRQKAQEAAEMAAASAERASQGFDKYAESVKKTTRAMEEQQRAAKKLEDDTDRLIGEFDRVINSFTPGGRALEEQLGSQLRLYERLMDAGLFRAAEILKEEVEQERRRVQALEDQAKVMETIAKKKKQIAAEQEREKKRMDDMKRSMKDQLLLLRAETNAERERIRIRLELRDALQRAGKDEAARLLAQEIAKQKLVNLERRLAEEAERKAKAAEKSTKKVEQEAKAQAEIERLLKKQADITKRFANFKGKSIFGFGAGQIGTGFGNVTGRVNVLPPKIAGRGQTTGGGGSSPVKVPKLPDPTKNIQAVEAAIKSIRSTLQRLTSATKKAARETRRDVTGFANDVTQSLEAAAGERRAMRNDLKSLSQRVARAGNSGVAGQ